MRREKIFREAKIKPEEKTYNDICTTCNHFHICTTRKNRQRPIWFCEEFDNYVPVKEQAFPDQPIQSQPESIPTKHDSPQLMGLCINCEDRDICKFAKPNGGVWHCEEYR